MRNMIINLDDVPSSRSLSIAVERLTKDHDLLQRFRGKSNKNDDPAALLEIARFLEMIVAREGKRLSK